MGRLGDSDLPIIDVWEGGDDDDRQIVLAATIAGIYCDTHENGATPEARQAWRAFRGKLVDAIALDDVDPARDIPLDQVDAFGPGSRRRLLREAADLAATMRLVGRVDVRHVLEPGVRMSRVERTLYGRIRAWDAGR